MTNNLDVVFLMKQLFQNSYQPLIFNNYHSSLHFSVNKMFTFVRLMIK